MFGLTLAACAGEAEVGGPDAAEGTPEASVPMPDAALGTADAGVLIPDAGVDAGPERFDLPTPVQVTWAPCALYSEGGGPPAECATVRAPLDPRDPRGATVPLFVKRFRPPGGRGARALWMLQGGPGASGYVFERLSEAFSTRFPDVDYYMPDHRGTGRSSRLGCAAEEADESAGGLSITPDEWPACRAAVTASVGAALRHYTLTAAAHDLGVLIASARAPGQPTFVYGVSYGTAWAQRYLQLFPAQVDGVVLDSIAPPGLSLLRQDEDANIAARDFVAVCGADAFCASKLGPDPWARATATFERLKAGHCAAAAIPEAPTHVLLRRLFGSFLMDANMRAYVAAILYRAERCAPGDVLALRALLPLAVRPQPPTLEQRYWGWIVSTQIALSEFGESPAPTAADLEAQREATVASRDVTTLFEPNLDWPRYPLDGFAGRSADTSTPMLMLSGALDPATILGKARALRSVFTRPNQTWVEFPRATHTTVVSSPYVDDVGERRSCGTRLMMAFLEAPTTPLDTGCVARTLPIDFRLPRADLNFALFGTGDAWE